LEEDEDEKFTLSLFYFVTIITLFFLFLLFLQKYPPNLLVLGQKLWWKG
jgi:hypothetical protein